MAPLTFKKVSKNTFRSAVKLCTYLTCFFSLLILNSCTQEDHITLAAIFSDNMVLQQNSEVIVWGWTKPGTAVYIENSWNQAVSEGRANKDGKFNIKIKTPEAGGPYTVKVCSENDITLKNVMIGEVWLCSGQSNMEMPMVGYPWSGDTISGSKSAIENSTNDNIRLFQVGRNLSFSPTEISEGIWKEADPSSVAWFSSLAYFFGKELYDSLKVPIGMISCSYGGTPIEAWLSDKVISNSMLYSEFVKDKNLELKAHSKHRDSIQKELQLWLTNSRELPLEYEEHKTILQPIDIDQTIFAGFLGELIYEKSFQLPRSTENDTMIISLGTINDIGQVYFNDSLVWEELFPSQSQSKCTVSIPPSSINSATNRIRINLVNYLWGGGLTGPENTMFAYYKQNKKNTISLSGEWEVMKSFTISEKNPIPKEGVPHFQMASSVYNGMLHQLIPFKVKGFLWYQGESNISSGYAYTEMMHHFVNSIRSDWNEQLPFYYVQIAPFNYKSKITERAAVIREAQRLACEIENTAMVVSLDLGINNNIHPPFKQEIGHRLALHAFSKLYGFNSINPNGPQYSHISLEDDVIRVHFVENNARLILRNSTKSGFEICGPDSLFLPAEATISGKDLVLQNSQISNPIITRYAWSDTAAAILFNSENLPASPFLSSSYQNTIHNK